MERANGYCQECDGSYAHRMDCSQGNNVESSTSPATDQQSAQDALSVEVLRLKRLGYLGTELSVSAFEAGWWNCYLWVIKKEIEAMRATP